MNVIKVDNLKGNFFGGMPFDVNWSFNGGNSPSRLVISVVNEKGEYANPETSLNFQSPESIQIGDFTFKGYLISYQFKNTPDKKILELTYVDKSIDLDRYFVGLTHRWGEKETNIAENLILVGKSYHPCDKNLDSVIAYEEVEGQVDPCDPCPEMPPNKYEKACDPILEDFNIFEVYYTFNDLIAEIKSKNFTCKLDTKDYKKYRSNHIGPLRNVLNSWCGDLGLAFFWDPTNNELIFVSRNKTVEIPSQSDLESNDNVIDLEYQGSIENTFTQGSIGYLARQGNIENYNCEKSTLENLRCLTLGALAEDGTFGNSPDESGGRPSNISDNLKDLKEYEMKEIAIALSYYSSEMRDAILWFNYYNHYSIQDVESRLKESKGDKGQGPSKNKLPPKLLSFFGNLEILAAYSPESEEQQDKANFTILNDLLTEDQINIYNLGISGPETRGTLEKPNYYFFIGRSNEELYIREKERERDLAENFLGRFWTKDFEITIPNASNTNTEVTIEAPEGNGEWYYHNSQLKNLNLFDFGHEEKSYIGKLDNEIPEIEEKYQEKIKKYIEDEKEKEFMVKGFILHDRQPKWFPEKDFAKWYQSLFDWYEAQTPRKFTQADGRPEELFVLYPEALNDRSIRLYIARKGLPSVYKTKIEVMESTKHPNEPKKKPIKNETEQDIFGDIMVKEICSYGIGEKAKYIKLTIGEEKDMEIHTPVEAFERSEAPIKKLINLNGNLLYTEKPPESSETGYDVIVKSQSNFQIVFPKYEYVSQFNARNVLDAANVIYHYEEIQEENLNYFRKNKGAKLTSTRVNCQIDKEEVDKYMEEANKFTRYDMVDTQKRASFRTAGVFPLNYNIINNGLSNVSIVINDNGVFTDYVLEDRIISPPSIDILKQNLRNFRPIKNLKNRGSVAPINKTNIKKYENAVRKFNTQSSPARRGGNTNRRGTTLPPL